MFLLGVRTFIDHIQGSHLEKLENINGHWKFMVFKK